MSATVGLRRGPFAMVLFNPRGISVAEGMRAALSIAVIVALNEYLNWPPMMEAALAALLTCLCDAGGPIRKRLPAIFTFAVLGSLITASYGLLRQVPLGVVIPVACFSVFCTSFARVYGQSAMQVGNLLTVVSVLALRYRLPDLPEALTLGGMFGIGSLWALLLTMGIWRLHPYRPARQSVGEVWRALSVLTQDMREVLNHPDPHETRWDDHAREHRRMVREAIERAREAVMATVRVRGPVSGRAAQSALRLEAAEQIFGALIGLSDILADAPDAATRAAADRVLRLLRPVLVLLCRFTVTESAERLPWMGRAIKAIAGTVAPLPDTPLHGITDAIVQRLMIALAVATPDGHLPWDTSTTATAGWRSRLTGPILANLNWRSEALRHAVRAAVVAAPAFAITLNWPTEYGHWLTITLVMTMQPYFGLTFTRALERIGGTVLGGGLAAVLALVCTTPLSIAVALFPLAVIALSLRGVSFGLFITCLTPLVVLLSEIGRPGESELFIAVMRALYTMVGGGLAVLGCFLLWPSWEPGRLARELRGAIAAHGRYAHAEIDALLTEDDAATAAAVEQARRAAGMASNNVEASLQRALMEPGQHSSSQTGPTRMQAALTVDAALRRMAGRLSALQLDPHHYEHDAAAWRGWQGWIDTVTQRLSIGHTDLPPRPALPRSDPQAESLTRIARQLELSAGAMARLG